LRLSTTNLIAGGLGVDKSPVDDCAALYLTAGHTAAPPKPCRKGRYFLYG